MTRYLPDPSIPVAPLSPALLDALRVTAAPLYAAAYTTPEGDWQVSVLEAPSADTRMQFRAATLDEAGRRIEEQGYVALADVLQNDWEKLPDGAKGTAVYRD